MERIRRFFSMTPPEDREQSLDELGKKRAPFEVDRLSLTVLTQPQRERVEAPTTPDPLAGNGTFEYSDTKQKFKGDFVSKCLTGSGTLTLDDGRVYQGNFVDGKLQGKGKSIWPDGTSYEGDFFNNKQHGQGKLTYDNGDRYEGGWRDGKLNGYGEFTDFDGNRYEGNWRDGRRNGHGKSTYFDGSRYEGDWRDDERNGHGKSTYFDGSRYEGDWRDGRRNGQGKMTYADGNRYEGDWRDGKRNGQGELIYPDGTTFKGVFINDIEMGDVNSLSELRFLGLLTGNLSESTHGYSLSVVSEFLKQQNDPAHEELNSALEILVSSKPRIGIAADILKKLQQGKPQLLSYGHKGHAMGLKIRQIEKGDYCFDIFNSGDGLQYHPKTIIFSGGYTLFQTMLRYHIPKDQVTEELLVKILDCQDLKNAGASYGLISKIPGVLKVNPEPFEAVWQTEQKSGNCALEWIFSYLRNTKGLHDYTRMRRKLYEAALETSKEPQIDNPNQIIKLTGLLGYFGPTTNLKIQEAYARVRQELHRKLHKPHPVIDKPQSYSEKIWYSLFSKDSTGATSQRIEAIKKAKDLVDKPKASVEDLRESLSIFRKLVDKGEGLQEAAAAAKKLAGDSNPGIQHGAMRLMREIAAQNAILYEFKNPNRRAPFALGRSHS